MLAILSETGLAFNVTKYAEIYGNEALLKLLKRFTIRTIDRATKIPQVTKTYRLAKIGDAKILELPRFTKDTLMADGPPSAIKPLTSIQVDLPLSLPSANLSYTGKSNANQIVVVNHVTRLFEEGVAGATLKVQTGAGKTYIAMDLIGRMKCKTLIIVPNTYLLEQWLGLLSSHFPDASIGTLYGKAKRDGDIIVGIINTVSELKEFETVKKVPWPNVGKTQKYMRVRETIAVDDILRTVGLTICDESQMYVSKEFRKAFSRIWSRHTIGLSATPDIREDKLDIIHQKWLGPIVDANELPGYSKVQDTFESDVQLIEYHALDEHCKFEVREDGMINYASIVESLITDPHRNNIIVESVLELMKKKLYTFVFSDRRAHLEHLFGLLEMRCKELDLPSALELPESGRNVILYGGASDDTISAAKLLSTVVLTTYAYSSTGVSITKMNALVLSTPRRSNLNQISGRVFRLGSDQTVRRQIVDIVDAKMPIKRQIQERMKCYRERESVITKNVMKAVGG